MIIELSDEIAQIIDKIQAPDSPESKAINKLFELMSENKHVVYASIPLLEKIKNFKYISLDNKKYIADNLLAHYVDLYSSLPVVKKKLIVKASSSKKTGQSGDIYIDLNKCRNLTRAKLSAEHPDDAFFYENIFNYLNKNNIYTVNFENNSFSGGNAESCLKAIDEELNIVLAISDSDKEYEGYNLGNTAKKVIDAVNNAQKAIMGYYILGVREIENLIPIELYLNIITKGEVSILLNSIKQYSMNDEFVRFINIKDGIRKTYEDNSDEKWHALYDGFIKTCKDEGIYDNTTTENRNKYCIKGVGSKNAKRVMSKIFLTNNTNNPKYDIKIYLSSCIMKEWNNIYEYLMCYGCALKPTHNSFL